jgi:hypothetical protein
MLDVNFCRGMPPIPVILSSRIGCHRCRLFRLRAPHLRKVGCKDRQGPSLDCEKAENHVNRSKLPPQTHPYSLSAKLGGSDGREPLVHYSHG